MTPKIAVLPLYNAEKDNFWINPMYTAGILEAGGLPVVLPLSRKESVWEEYLSAFDGFLIPGGQDVAPSYYGQEVLPACGYAAPLRDEQETYMLKRLWELDKPVLGICRGLQIMNTAWGGTLYQDLPTQKPSSVTHRQPKPYEIPHHQVTIAKDSMLYGILGYDRLSVNSMHHQALWELSPRVKAVAWAEDGIVEAIEVPEKTFMLGVQWHPEHLFRDYDSGKRIFKAFVNAAAQAAIL